MKDRLPLGSSFFNLVFAVALALGEEKSSSSSSTLVRAVAALEDTAGVEASGSIFLGLSKRQSGACIHTSSQGEDMHACGQGGKRQLLVQCIHHLCIVSEKFIQGLAVSYLVVTPACSGKKSCRICAPLATFMCFAPGTRFSAHSRKVSTPFFLSPSA